MRERPLCVSMGPFSAMPTFNHPIVALLARLTLLAVLCGPTPAWAQESAQTLAARTLFDEGRQLMSEGRHGEACVKFEESQRLRAGIGTEFNLAECYEKTGRTASAWSRYLHVAAETKAQGQLERERVARERAEALVPKLTRVRLAVAKPEPGLMLTLDGEVMSEATWNIATPIDPGPHELHASAPGYEPWQATKHIPDSPGEVRIEVPALKALHAASAPAEAAPGTEGSATAEPDRPSARSRRTAYIVGGVGAAGVLLSGLFGLRAVSKNGEAEEVCKDRETACPPAEIERHRSLTAEAKSARSAGFVTLGLGLVGLGVGAVLLFDPFSSKTDQGALRVAPRWTADGWGLDVSARF